MLGRRAVIVALFCATLISTVLLPAMASEPPTDQAIAAGLWDGVNLRTYGALAFDYDGDGRQDALIVPHLTQKARLFHNDGDGTFTQVDGGQFPRLDRHGCDSADANLDGLVDIYCVAGADGGTKAKSNELWIQTSLGTFQNQAVAWGVQDEWGRGRQPVFIDANHDPYPDLYVTNEYPRKDSHLSPNRLFINVDGTSFRSAPEYGLDVEVGGTLGIQVGVQAVDLNGDGWTDILVCGKKGLKMYVSDAGSSFTDVRAAVRLPTGTFFDGELADMNGDGTLDFVGLGKSKVAVYPQLNGLFQTAKYTVAVTAPRQLAVKDLDGDGDPDVYVVTGASSGANLPDLLLENDGAGSSSRAPRLLGRRETDNL